MTSAPEPDTERAADPADRDAEVAGLREALGMGAVREPIPVDVAALTHDRPVGQPDPALARAALEEHARHAKREAGEG